MKEATARMLHVGDRVCWDHNKADGGTVIDKGFNAVTVKWDNPAEGEFTILYFTTMANIGLLPKQYAAADVTNVTELRI